MVYTTAILFLCVLVLPFVTLSGFLDLEELESSVYNLKISDTPVSLTQTEDLKVDHETVEVSSKYGQRYLCHYQKTATSQSIESSDKLEELNITDILEPMRGNCIIKTKDWWTYKFCYGESITQFHLHEGQVSGDTITLGKYESDKTWLPEDLEKLKKSTVNRYHTQSYVNGTLCDLTEKPRRAEVRFSCVEGEVDRIGAITELKPCSYIIFVYTSKICHHPYLQSPSQATALPIECQPIISQGAYNDYLKQLHDEDFTRDTGVSRGYAVGGVDMSAFDSLLRSLGKDVDETEVYLVGEEEDFAGKLEEQKQALLELLQETMRENTGKDAVSKYKETIKKYVSSQFDDIIAEAKSELGEDEETADNVDIEKLKGVMSSALDSQLDGLQDLEETANELVKEVDATDSGMQSEKAKVEASQKSDEGKSKLPKPGGHKSKRKGKLSSEQEYDLGIIDTDDFQKSSHVYFTTERAGKPHSDMENKRVKAVIAVVRSSQEKDGESKKQRK